MLEKYSPCDNADETGIIYYRALPDGTLEFSTDELSGSKKSKDRVTAMVATSMDGTDKRLLLIIGKSKQPRCFRGLSSLPLPYNFNKNAWMTGDIFREWLVELNKDMGRQKRKIALIVDNCAAHPRNADENCDNIQLIFFHQMSRHSSNPVIWESSEI